MKRTILAMASCALIGAAPADQVACNAAIDQYNDVQPELSRYVASYQYCVSGSKGTDDCAAEFRRLKNQQFDFEMAVSAYGSNCNEH